LKPNQSPERPSSKSKESEKPRKVNLQKNFLLMDEDELKKIGIKGKRL
jgi:hypothetical protein